MKYIIILGDGMADLPVPELSGKTPLQVADKPEIDRLAREGLCGLVNTIPAGLAPGSDTANMAVMGYDPKRYYTGRSPLEAISMSIEMEPEDVVFRTNLVTLSEDPVYAHRTMIDHSSDEIQSDEAARLIELVNERLAGSDIRFYPGKSYRHCLIWKNGPIDMRLVPPHDILTRQIAPYLPVGEGAARILELMEASAAILPDHPVSKARARRGLNAANSIWIWGQGRKPNMPNLSDMFGIKGSVVSAVDLIQGLGICAGLHVVQVPGATGNIHTNFRGKAQAAIDEFKRGQDYVFVHIEAPDECGHRAEVENKVKSIGLIDREIVAPVWAHLEAERHRIGEEYRILVMPDHPTPLTLRTHTSDPVPFALYSSDGRYRAPTSGYDEERARESGICLEEGYRLFGKFIKGEEII